MQQVQRAADFVMAGNGADMAGIDPEDPEDGVDDGLHGQRHRGKDEHHDADDRRHAQRETVGAHQRQRLGQHLGKDHHRRRHGDGGIGNARLAEQRDEHACRQGRGQDVDDIVAKENGPDQPLLFAGEGLDQHRTLVARARQLMHAGARRCRQRRFRAGKEKAHRQQQQDAGRSQPQGNAHDARA
ncbi:hypothetical protein D3C87_1441880 [compost metagenome]